MGSNPTGVAILHPSKVSWPSGLRRSTQVRVSSEAWVRTPPEPFLFYKNTVNTITFYFERREVKILLKSHFNGYNRSAPKYCNTGATSGFESRSELDLQRLKYRNNVNHLEDTWSSYQRLS